MTAVVIDLAAARDRRAKAETEHAANRATAIEKAQPRAVTGFMPSPKTVYHRPLSALAAEPEDSRELWENPAGYRCPECGGVIWENVESHLFHTCEVEPLSLPWQESRRGNPYTTTPRFHCVVYPTGRAWGYRITDRETDQGAYGYGRFSSENEAKVAAEKALRELAEGIR